jgi:hypothetical protein
VIASGRQTGISGGYFKPSAARSRSCPTKPRLGSVLLNAAAAEQRRRDPVEGRGMVQADEGICLEPVSAHTVAPVDQGHPHIGVVDKSIHERHAGGAGPTTR